MPSARNTYECPGAFNKCNTGAEGEEARGWQPVDPRYKEGEGVGKPGKCFFVMSTKKSFVKFIDTYSSLPMTWVDGFNITNKLAP